MTSVPGFILIAAAVLGITIALSTDVAAGRRALPVPWMRWLIGGPSKRLQAHPLDIPIAIALILPGQAILLYAALFPERVASGVGQAVAIAALACSILWVGFLLRARPQT
jgi:hypothetical protein